MDAKEFRKLCKDNHRKYDKEMFKTLYRMQEEGYHGLDIAEVMIKSSTETLEKICKLIEGGSLSYYSNYDELMECEGSSACSFICGEEIRDDTFMALYNQGLIDDDKIYNCIAVNHTVYHPSDSYSEPYVVWFNQKGGMICR